MMKKHRTMIIFLAIFVVLFGLYFFMKHTNEKQAEKEQVEPSMLTQLDEISSMEYTDGETTLSFVKKEDTWVVKDNEAFKLDSDAVETIADTLCQVAAVRVLSGAEELASYGLEQPSYTVIITDETGSEQILYIGNATGENYYATVGEKSVVYVVDSAAVEALEFDLSVLEME